MVIQNGELDKRPRKAAVFCIPCRKNFFPFFETMVPCFSNIPTEGGEMMDQEARWIRDIQKRGSRTAAESLISAYYDAIYCFAYRQTGNREDAMDLTQNIFLAVLRAIHTYNGKQAAFRTWLYRIAVNKIIDRRRKLRPGLVPLEDMELPDPEDFAVQVQDRALLEEIEAYVSALSPQVQAIFRLRVYGERSFPEIAAALGEKEAAVKTRYYRLMSRLRKEFTTYD